MSDSTVAKHLGQAYFGRATNVKFCENTMFSNTRFLLLCKGRQGCALVLVLGEIWIFFSLLLRGVTVLVGSQACGHFYNSCVLQAIKSITAIEQKSAS